MMKLILAISLLGFTYKSQATNYYVSNVGNDANAGTSPGASWQHVSKVNSSVFNPDDSVLFNGGDSWNEALRFPSSGTSGHVIYIGAYGTGANPIITGLQTVTGWTDSTGNFWVANVPNSVAYQNTVLINGVITAKGRYPNVTNLTCNEIGYTKISTIPALPFDPTGAEVVLRSYAWIIDVSKINSVSGINAHDTFYVQPLTYNLTNQFNYFIQNSINCLDTQNEWAYDSLNKKLYIYSTLQPSAQISVLDTVVSTHNRSYLTFQNIQFQGGNRITFSMDSGSNVILKNYSINYSGMNGIGLNKSPKTTIQNGTINNSLNDGIYTRWPSDSTLFDTDTIKNSGTIVGMGLSGNAASEAVFAYGNTIKFQNNRTDSAGYNAYTWFGGLRDTVYRNYITNFCLTKADGSGIYTDGNLTSNPQTGSLVRSNIVDKGIGFDANNAVSGIYMDNQSTGIRIDSNTVSNIFRGGDIALNGGSNFTVRDNTAWAYQGTTSTAASGASFFVGNSIAFGTSTIINNIFYSTYRFSPVVYFGTGTGTSTEDSNYVLRANASDSLFHDGGSTYYNLATWRTATGLDAHTSIAFPASSNSTTGTLYINPTQSDSTITFSGKKVDAKNNKYIGSITLHSFQSALLFPAFGDNVNIVEGIKIL